MRKLFRNIQALIGAIFLSAVWLGPCLISLHESNWWFVALYLVWWIPALIMTAIIAVFFDPIRMLH